MSPLTITIALTMLVTLGTTVSAMQCGYTDTEGYLYDFAELHNSNDYVIIDTTKTYIYRINVCDTVTEQQCRAKNGVVCQYVLDAGNNGDSLLQLNAVLATANGAPPTWSEDDDNIYQTFSNGNSQFGGAPEVQFKYECNDKPSSGTSAGVKPLLLPSSTSDAYVFEFQVQQACAEYLDRTIDSTDDNTRVGPDGSRQRPGGPPVPRSRHRGMHTSTLLFMLLCIFAFIYFIGGIMYNRQSHGLSGVDALPHRDFWTELPGLVADGVKYVTDKSADVYHRLRGNAVSSRTGSSATYEQI